MRAGGFADSAAMPDISRICCRYQKDGAIDVS